MLRARAFALATFAILLFAACSTGETQVEGGGTPATGPTASGPTATGPTGETAAGEFDGPVTVEPLGNISFTDTIDLVIAGTADAPAFRATAIDVKIDSAVPGLDQIARSFFKKNTEVPILAGAKQC